MVHADLRVIDPTSEASFPDLLRASLDEGYGFVQKLYDEYQSGVNRFDAPGALLLGALTEPQLIGVGGVHPDPYLDDPGIGRVRHLYVLPAMRRAGVGRRLMDALIGQSSAYFRLLTLRTLNPEADLFYRALGFSAEPRYTDATHWLALKP
jgi:GNAT superfamily N-acetyltransferase